MHVTLTPGQKHEMTVAHELLTHARGKALISDAGYDSNAFLPAVRNSGQARDLRQPYADMARRLDALETSDTP